MRQLNRLAHAPPLLLEDSASYDSGEPATHISGSASRFLF